MRGTGSAKPQDRLQAQLCSASNTILPSALAPTGLQTTGFRLPPSTWTTQSSFVSRPKEMEGAGSHLFFHSPLGKAGEARNGHLPLLPLYSHITPSMLKENSRKKESGLDCRLRPSPATPLYLWARSLTEISLSRKEEKQIVVTYVGKGDI